MIRTALFCLAAALATGCLDSLVDDPCIEGYHLDDGACVAVPAPTSPAPDNLAELVEPTEPTEPTDPTDPDPPGPTPPGGLSPDVCAPPRLTCSNVCVDLATDPDHCGACGTTCASGTCSAGACVP